MVQSPSWEANWFAASQEIPRISRNPKVHYRAQKRPPPVSILGQPSPVQSIYPYPTSWRSILILSTHLRLGLPSGLLPSGFPTNTLYTTLSSPIRATCPAYFILLDFITRTILGEEYRSFSASLCNLLHSPVTSSLLGPNILLNTMFSNTLSFLSSRNVNDQVSHPYKITGKIIVIVIDYFHRKYRFFSSVKTRSPYYNLKTHLPTIFDGLCLIRRHIAARDTTASLCISSLLNSSEMKPNAY